jgi:hypothetical protein
MLYEESLKFNDKQTWEEIVKKHIFLICRTNLSKQVAMEVLYLKENDRNIQVLDVIANDFKE